MRHPRLQGRGCRVKIDLTVEELERVLAALKGERAARDLTLETLERAAQQFQMELRETGQRASIPPERLRIEVNDARREQAQEQQIGAEPRYWTDLRCRRRERE